MRILNFGSCNLDHTYAVDRFVAPGETLAASRLDRFVGGKGLNQSIALARAGASVCHAGFVGHDGASVRDALAAAGVDTAHLRTADAPTGHAIIQVTPAGENCILLYPGANAALTPAFVDEVLENFDKNDLVLLQNETSCTAHIIDAAHARGLRVAFNPAPFTEALRDIDLNKLDYLILNEVESFGFSGEKDPQTALKYYQNRTNSLKVVITLGSDGCLFYDTSTAERLRLPAYAVAVRDTTSAGDTFTGYFLAALARDPAAHPAPPDSAARGGGSHLSAPPPSGDASARSACPAPTDARPASQPGASPALAPAPPAAAEGARHHAALTLASAAAAIATTRPGASPSIPTLAEVEKLLPTLTPQKVPKTNKFNIKSE